LRRLIFKILCNRFTGKLIHTLFGGDIPNIRTRGFQFRIPERYTTRVIQSSVLWGFYESAERRLILENLRSDLPVIELGGSLGIVSSYIVSRLAHGSELVIVEANPNLKSFIEYNVTRHNRNKVAVSVINKAVAYEHASVFLSISDNNTSSHLVDNEQKGVEIESVRLSDIVEEHRFSEFSLVCDIEGCEVEVIERDFGTLKKCRQIFMEIHDTEYKGTTYNRGRILDTMVRNGFKLAARDGNVLYLENTALDGGPDAPGGQLSEI
jgi:FkbM family methyltransferase